LHRSLQEITDTLGDLAGVRFQREVTRVEKAHNSARAVAAGWQAALIKRVGNDVLGVGPQPHIVGTDLNDVADQLIRRHRLAA